jgi:hypothetical protein
MIIIYSRLLHTALLHNDYLYPGYYIIFYARHVFLLLIYCQYATYFYQIRFQ